MKLILLVILIAILFFGASCGDPPPTQTTTTKEPLPEEIILQFKLDRDGLKGPLPNEVKEVNCPAENIRQEAICQELGNLREKAYKKLTGGICTDLYGGPDRARIRGKLGDEEIDVFIRRNNGCQIERFNAWLPVLRILYPSYRPGQNIN